MNTIKLELEKALGASAQEQLQKIAPEVEKAIAINPMTGKKKTKNENKTRARKHANKVLKNFITTQI